MDECVRVPSSVSTHLFFSFMNLDTSDRIFFLTVFSAPLLLEPDSFFFLLSELLLTSIPKQAVLWPRGARRSLGMHPRGPAYFLGTALLFRPCVPTFFFPRRVRVRSCLLYDHLFGLRRSCFCPARAPHTLVKYFLPERLFAFLIPTPF